MWIVKQSVRILVFIFSGHPKASLKINFLFNGIENKSWTPDAFESMIDYILLVKIPLSFVGS